MAIGKSKRAASAVAPKLTLREAAEADLRSPGVGAAAQRKNASAAANQPLDLVHELSVHQVELEMQNDELRRRQTELEAQRATYVDLFDLAPVGYSVIDEHGNVCRANPAAGALLGMPREALVGQCLAAFVVAEDAAAYTALIRRAPAGAATPSGELRMLRHGAASWWASIVVGAVSTATGASLRHVILSDITLGKAASLLVAAESQRTERALALNRVLIEVRDFDVHDVGAYVRGVTEAAARAMGAARVSLWAVEMDGTVLQCRDRFEAGTSVLEPGARVASAAYPRYFAALREGDVLAVEDALADPRTNEFADGYLRPMGISSMLDAPLHVGGRLAGVLCIEHCGPPRRWSAEEQSFAHALANMALHALAHVERGHAVAARQSTERQLRTLLDGMADRAWLKDREGRYLALNRSEAMALGVPIEQALGKTIQELRPDVPLLGPAAEHAHALAANVPTRIERVAALGGDVWLEIIRSPVLGADGNVEGLVGIARDVTERKRTQSALVQSEARFRALTEMSSDWYWETDAQGRYTMMVGRDGVGPHLRSRDSIGRGHAEIQVLTGAVREQLSPSWDEYERLRAERGVVRNALCKWTFPDGRMTFLRFSFEPMFDADGQFLGNRGVTSDVTQRERDAQALSQAHHELELAMRTAGIAIHEWDLSLGTVKIRAGHGVGMGTVVELAEEQAMALLHPDDGAAMRGAIDQIRRGVASSADVEFRVRGASGAWTWRGLHAKVTEIDLGTGAPVRVTGASTDIESRKRAELALAELNRELEARIASRTEALALSEARFRAVMNDAPVGIAIIAPDRRIVDANSRICDILGYPKQALIGMGIQEITHPDDWPANAGLAAPMERGELQHFVMEKRYLRGDGGVVWARLHVAAVNDAQGKHQYRISVIEDITERRETEARLREYSAQVSALTGRMLRAQEDERRHLARELHDEIGQVLTAVKMALGAVQQRPASGGDDAAVVAANAVVNTAIARVRNLWKELRPPVLDDLGLAAALGSLCAQAERLSPMTAALEVQGEATAVAKPLAEVLYRICQEALTNAVRHSGASRVDVCLRTLGGEVALHVRDNGAGFDAASASRTDGLGLVGMRERVKILDGTLVIDSTPGAGTRISAAFGAARAAAKAPT